MKIFVSGRPFYPETSGGQFGLMRRIVESLSRDFTDIQIDVSVTPFNEGEIGMRWPACVKRHRLEPENWHMLSEKESEVISSIDPKWVIRFFPTTEDSYDFDSSIRVATFIPDLQHVHYPENFQERELKGREKSFLRAVQGSDLILTVSESARKDIIGHYNCDPRRVMIVFPGGDWDDMEENEIREGRARLVDKHPSLWKDGFALYSANNWTHKNHAGLLQAMAILKRSGSPLHLVLTGSDKCSEVPLSKLIRDAGVEDRVLYLGYVSDADLKILTKEASFCVFPSLFEGFGIPVLNALGVGKIVVCSDLPSLREIAGDAAIYFDPANPEDMADAMIRTARESDTGAGRGAMGKEKAGRFTYTRAAADLLKYLSLAEELPLFPPNCSDGFMSLKERRLELRAEQAEEKALRAEERVRQEEEKLRQTEERASQSEEDLRHLRAELLGVRSSICWRLTAPLRWCDAQREKIF